MSGYSSYASGDFEKTASIPQQAGDNIVQEIGNGMVR
jgi:hypothetical protein